MGRSHLPDQTIQGIEDVIAAIHAAAEGMRILRLRARTRADLEEIDYVEQRLIAAYERLLGLRREGR